jgi:hypothetical protein
VVEQEDQLKVHQMEQEDQVEVEQEDQMEEFLVQLILVEVEVEDLIEHHLEEDQEVPADRESLY